MQTIIQVDSVHEKCVFNDLAMAEHDRTEPNDFFFLKTGRIYDPLYYPTSDHFN